MNKQQLKEETIMANKKITKKTIRDHVSFVADVQGVLEPLVTDCEAHEQFKTDIVNSFKLHQQYTFSELINFFGNLDASESNIEINSYSHFYDRTTGKMYSTEPIQKIRSLDMPNLAALPIAGLIKAFVNKSCFNDMYEQIWGDETIDIEQFRSIYILKKELPCLANRRDFLVTAGLNAVFVDGSKINQVVVFDCLDTFARPIKLLLNMDKLKEFKQRTLHSYEYTNKESKPEEPVDSHCHSDNGLIRYHKQLADGFMSAFTETQMPNTNSLLLLRDLCQDIFKGKIKPLSSVVDYDNEGRILCETILDFHPKTA
jgi:hypothetical protein